MHCRPSRVAKSCLIAALVAFCTFRIGAEGHRCYICVPPSNAGPDAEEIAGLFPNQMPPPPCATFDDADAKYQYECPSDMTACLTLVKGSNVGRTCTVVAVNDCQMANGVLYCYCTGQLCNRNIPEHLRAENTGRADVKNEMSLVPAETIDVSDDVERRAKTTEAEDDSNESQKNGTFSLLDEENRRMFKSLGMDDTKVDAEEGEDDAEEGSGSWATKWPVTIRTTAEIQTTPGLQEVQDNTGCTANASKTLLWFTLLIAALVQRL